MSLTVETIIARLSYDPATGNLVWLPRPVREGRWRRHDLAWNTKYAGHATGNLNYHGYLVTNIGGRPHAVHRLAWVLAHGEWPAQFLDHINGDRTDNRLCNLRAATPAQNCMNADIRRDNTSGAKGVVWHPQSGKWRASIKVKGKRRSLGLHGTVAAAATAYALAAQEEFGEYACGGRP